MKMDLAVKGHFDAAHSLRNYDGPCARLHGHRWEVQAVFRGVVDGINDNEGLGLLVDFKTVKKWMDKALGCYDHKHLNELPPFDKINPTAENLAPILFTSLRTVVAQENARGRCNAVELVELTVWESPGCAVTVRGDK